jgi:two-component system response regulator FixJ
MSDKPFAHVIDDDDAVRESLAFLLETEGVEVKSYESAAAFLARLAEAEDGCIITDVRMPDMNGLELVRRLNALGVTMPVIVVTGHADVALAVEAMKEGVSDFIEKPFADDAIIAAFRAALDRARGRQGEHLQRLAISQRLASLSTRERQVLDGLVAGQPNKAVARTLDISPRTVEVYRANLMTKMQAQSLSELVRMALLANG